MKKCLIIILMFLLNSCSHDTDKKDSQNQIEMALVKLKSRNNRESWVVITAGFSQKFIQFYSVNSEIYLDFPVTFEVKNKYRDKKFDGKIDRINKETFFVNSLSDHQKLNIINLLNKHNLPFLEMRKGFIEPTNYNQTDTTGWVTSIKGKFTIPFNKAKQFIDEYFSTVYGINTDSIMYSIEEN